MRNTDNRPYDQTVYLLQGGGALGSYQVGVCQVLLENNFEPDWIVGTSIGAINGAIIAGNKPQHRIKKLREFWDHISFSFSWFIDPQDNILFQEFKNYLYSQWIVLYGQPNFFKPRMLDPFLFATTTPDKMSFYDTSELRKTLNKVIDFDLINEKKVRLTLGAVQIKGGKAVRFDNCHQVIGPEHIMASSALPPGFPAVKINNEYYWDGGLSSNTPFAVVAEENDPKKLLCFIVNLFTYPEYIPSSFWEVYKYKKEIEFASRHQEVLRHFCELHYLQHIINELAKTVENNQDLERAAKKIKEAGYPTSLNTIWFHYRDRPSNLWSKDFNFSQDAIQEHWQAGYADAKKALAEPSWKDIVVGDSGVVIHEF